MKTVYLTLVTAADYRVARTAAAEMAAKIAEANGTAEPREVEHADVVEHGIPQCTGPVIVLDGRELRRWYVDAYLAAAEESPNDAPQLFVVFCHAPQDLLAPGGRPGDGPLGPLARHLGAGHGTVYRCGYGPLGAFEVDAAGRILDVRGGAHGRADDAILLDFTVDVDTDGDVTPHVEDPDAIATQTLRAPALIPPVEQLFLQDAHDALPELATLLGVAPRWNAVRAAAKVQWAAEHPLPAQAAPRGEGEEEPS